MQIGFIFWLFMLLWLVFGIWASKFAPTPAPWPFAAGNGFIWVLFFIVGWKVFGWPLVG